MNQDVETGDSVQFNSLGVGIAPSGVAGAILATNDVVAFSSDERLKENLEPCLLYTSPSPRDRQKSRMPSSA